MFKLSLAAARASSSHLVPALTGLALMAILALWAWALPSLLARGGFVSRGDAACEAKAYRDPVTGRLQPAPSPHLATTGPCPVRSDGATS